MNILERDLNNIQDGIQVQLKNLKQKLDKLGSRILDTNNLVTAQVGPYRPGLFYGLFCPGSFTICTRSFSLNVEIQII